MRASVRLQLPDGEQIELGHGDLVGRLWSAALYLDDARVSEAHALVSLRGTKLHLLALRRRFFIKHELCSEVALAPGLRVELADGLGFVVAELCLAKSVLGLRVVGRGARPLLGVVSITGEGDEGFVSGYRADAHAFLWNRDEDWRLQLSGQEAHPVAAGDRFDVAGRTFELVDLQGYSSREAAEMEQIDDATLRVHLSRARSAIRTAIHAGAV